MKIKEIQIIENIEVTDAGAEGVAVARHEGRVVFIKDAVPGDVVDVRIYRSKKSFLEGRVVKIHREGEMRTQAFCSHYGLCGGCKWQHLKYEGQLFYKQKQVEDAFQRIASVKFEEVLPILPSPSVTEYRNKMEYTFSCYRWLETPNPEATDKDRLALGFHIAGMFNKILDIKKCYLQNFFANEIRNSVREFAVEAGLSFYDVKNHKGYLRNIIIRNTTDGQWMVVVVFGYEDKEQREDLLDMIKEKFPDLTSLMYVINGKKNDVVNDLPVHLYHGQPFITETMHGLKFKIGPVSFYQTNPVQAASLYSVVKDFAGLSGTEIVYDLYTGTGTIANFIAADALKVVGIDNVEPAIADAGFNAKENSIHNAFFEAGDLVKVFTTEFIEKHGRADVVITDPPRSGMHPGVVDKLIELLPDKIVYVSCNPATQARDVALLAPYYRLAKIQAVDMFPHTSHVENVALLLKK